MLVVRRRAGHQAAERNEPAGDVDELRRRNRKLRHSLRVVSADRDRLAAEVDKLKTEKAALQAKLEEARREAKRQAAPFSKGRRTLPAERKRSGRRSGAEHGRHGHRRPPEACDEDLVAPLPETCPHCGCAEVSLQEWFEQYQDELVAAVVRRRFLVAKGRCASCKRSVRGRQPLQSSDALGAAGATLGPKAVALAAWLHYGCGLSAAKVARLFAELGLGVTPGGITGALLRLSGDATGTYDALVAALRASPVVSPDETGWRIDGERGWLWVFVGDAVTVYDIAIGPRRPGLRRRGGDPGGGLLRRAVPRRLGPLPPLRAGHAPDLHGSLCRSTDYADIVRETLAVGGDQVGEVGIIRGIRGRRGAGREDGSGPAWRWVEWSVPEPVP